MDVGAAEARLVGSLHDNALKRGAVAAGQHPAVGVVSSKVDAGRQHVRAALRCQVLAGREQLVEALAGVGSWAHRAELYVAAVARRLARAAVADREGHQLAAVCHQHGVAETALIYGADLDADVEPSEDRVGDLAALRLHGGLLWAKV